MITLISNDASNDSPRNTRSSKYDITVRHWDHVLFWFPQVVYYYFWAGQQQGLSNNSGTPKSSILIGFSIINHPFWGFPPIYGNTHKKRNHTFSTGNSRIHLLRIQGVHCHRMTWRSLTVVWLQKFTGWNPVARLVGLFQDLPPGSLT